MDAIVGIIINVIMSGGPQAILAILVMGIVLLVMERRRLLQELQRKDDKIDKIIEEYYKGNLTLSQALNSLKIVLYEIKSKI